MEVQLLLPRDLDQRGGAADLALVVWKIGGVYRGNTVLTLDMAYSKCTPGSPTRQRLVAAIIDT
jgi:hypothetical protein